MGRRKFKKAVAGTVAGRRKVDTKENATKKSGAKYAIDELLDKAQGCIDRFEYEVAQKFCQRVLELEPDNVRALETTGTLLMEMGNPEGAKQCFGRSVEVAPDSGHEKYMYLGQLFDGAQAVQCFQKGIELLEKELAEREAHEVSAACATGDDRSVSHSDVSRAYCSIAEIYMTDCCFEADAEEMCRVSVEKAITADKENPEAYQLMASYLLSKDEKQSAKENMQKSVSLWLPKFRSLQSGADTGEEFDPTQVCPLTFETRLAGARILIELEDYETGSEVLESLLDENDEDTEVWYLLGWLNRLHGEEYWGNARHYLTKASQMYKKTKCQDEPMLKHIEELMVELGPGDTGAEGDGDEAMNDNDDDDDDDDDWETDSEAEGDDQAAGDMEH